MNERLKQKVWQHPWQGPANTWYKVWQHPWQGPANTWQKVWQHPWQGSTHSWLLSFWQCTEMCSVSLDARLTPLAWRWNRDINNSPPSPLNKFSMSKYFNIQILSTPGMFRLAGMLLSIPGAVKHDQKLKIIWGVRGWWQQSSNICQFLFVKSLVECEVHWHWHCTERRNENIASVRSMQNLSGPEIYTKLFIFFFLCVYPILEDQPRHFISLWQKWTLSVLQSKYESTRCIYF